MFEEHNIYRKPTQKVQGMSSRQQVLFLMQKTLQEADWDMDKDSDIQNGNFVQSKFLIEFSQEGDYEVCGKNNCGSKNQIKGQQQVRTYNEEFELLAHSLTQFVPIKRNKYLERKRYFLSDKEANALVCTCQKSSLKKNEKNNPHMSFNCGERCINKCVSTECCPQTCPTGNNCMNRRFQLHQNAYVYPVKTEKKGWGLLAGEFIPRGTFIMQYVGEIFSVDTELGQQRVQKYKNSTCTYLMSMDNSEVIDPTIYGNIARFINHSCDPNCQTQKWHVLGEVMVGIFAIKDIRENEELSFDYQFDFYKTPYTKCYCGTEKCKGYLGVLATQGENQNNKDVAPFCQDCQKAITVSKELIVCRGPCKVTFHLKCIAKREGRKVGLQLLVDKKNYYCPQCTQFKQSKKKKTKKALDEEGEIDINTDMQDFEENPQEDRDLNQFPWDSLDPSIRYYYEDNEHNRILDKLVLREIENIEKEEEKKNSKKRKGTFSQFYNFMFELTKRLRIKMKENKINFKFRKPEKQSLIKSKTHSSLQKVQQSRQKSFSIRQQESKKIEQLSLQRRQRSMNFQKPKRASTQLQDVKKRNRQILSDDEYEFQADEKKQKLKKEIQKKKVFKKEDKEESKGGSSDSNSSSSSDSDSSENEEDMEEEEEEDSSASVEDEEEEEEEEEEEIVEISDDEEVDEEEEDQDDEMIEDEEDIRKEVIRKTKGYNLEELQEEEDEEEEVKQLGLDFSGLRPEENQYSMNLSEIVTINQKKRLKRLVSNENQVAIDGLKSSPRKNSLIQIEEEKKERANMGIMISQKIQEFISSQNLEEQEKAEVKESKISLYEPVFNEVVLENIDEFDCIQNLKLFWEQPWGGMVTLRLHSTYKQYQFLTSLFQEVTNFMKKNNLLTIKTDLVLTNDEQESLGTNLPPFDIIILQVPKNFLRKLVGYQDKNLNNYRKRFQVDFDYNRDLLSDEVYQINENTPLRIFGRGPDVALANNSLQKDLNKFNMKILILQNVDCKLIMDNVKEIKLTVDPCEIRVKRMQKEWKDMKHPFYFIPNYFREVALIGSDEEIEIAEKKIDSFFQSRRDAQISSTQQITFLLPIEFKKVIPNIKVQYQGKYPGIQIYYYEPTFPRKHLTILVVGQWKLISAAKKELEQDVNSYPEMRQWGTFENFTQQTYHQQLRFSFKSLKRFILEKDIKHLNHWDICSVFVENAGKPLQIEEENKSEEIEPQLSQPLQRQESVNKTSNNSNLLEQLIQGSQKKEELITQNFQQEQFLERTQSQQQNLQQKEEEQKKKQRESLLERQRLSDYNSFVHYIKHQDVETCINSLFVLSQSQSSLGPLMERLTIQPEELIQMMAHVLYQNIREHQESVYYRSQQQNQHHQYQNYHQYNKGHFQDYKHGQYQKYQPSGENSFRSHGSFHKQQQIQSQQQPQPFTQAPFKDDHYKQQRFQNNPAYSSIYPPIPSHQQQSHQDYRLKEKESERYPHYKSHHRHHKRDKYYRKRKKSRHSSERHSRKYYDRKSKHRRSPSYERSDYSSYDYTPSSYSSYSQSSRFSSMQRSSSIQYFEGNLDRERGEPLERKNSRSLSVVEEGAIQESGSFRDQRDDKHHSYHRSSRRRSRSRGSSRHRRHSHKVKKGYKERHHSRSYYHKEDSRGRSNSHSSEGSLRILPSQQQQQNYIPRWKSNDSYNRRGFNYRGFQRRGGEDNFYRGRGFGRGFEDSQYHIDQMQHHRQDKH